MTKIKIALLSGGVSGEREVSLRTGEEIHKALNEEKYEIFRYDPKDDLEIFLVDAKNKKFDLVFPALHGSFGEDGRLQGILDMIGMSYVFSGCLASALAMNKHKAKLVAREASLNVASNIILSDWAQYNLDGIIDILSLPIVIKPVASGSSVGMTIACNKEELQKGIELAFQYDSEIMLEKFIGGREFTVAVLGNKEGINALPVVEIIPKAAKFYDYNSKYNAGGSEHICPANISETEKQELQNMAVKAFRAIGCKDLARADFILSEQDNKFYFLEINTIPGMTSTSLTPEAARAAQIEFEDLLDTLIKMNIGR